MPAELPTAADDRAYVDSHDLAFKRGYLAGMRNVVNSTQALAGMHTEIDRDQLDTLATLVDSIAASWNLT